MLLKKGSRGSSVKAMQEALKRRGFFLPVDGSFGDLTENMVRDFQRSQALPVDGIAGPATLNVLLRPIQYSPVAVLPIQLDPQQQLQQLMSKFPPMNDFAIFDLSPSKGVQKIASLSMSEDGLSFIFRHESQHGVSNHLYWPRGASGVTLGAGYDMKERTAESIKADMIKIGIDSVTAAAVSAGATLSGDKAMNFASDNKKLVELSADQETELLRAIVPSYEGLVRRSLKIDLAQHEFDALVSFAYNPGGRFNRVATLLNNHQIKLAMTEMQRAVTSRGVVLPGLVKRRDDEVSLFEQGIYRAKKP